MWTGRNEDVQAFQSTVQTAKTSHLEVIKSHTRHVLANLCPVMAFYDTKRFKRLRWKTYISRQKTYEKLVADLKGGVEHTLVELSLKMTSRA